MAQIIEFYVPAKFQWKSNWNAFEDRGKLIAFPMLISSEAAPVVWREQRRVSGSNLSWVRSVLHARPLRG